jgi:tetratricopeptide (TPR) repeat protein
VTLDKGEVVGDAVDVVNRVERLSGAGRICMTETVYRRVRNKIGMPILKLGRGARKEIRASYDVYKLIIPWEEDRVTYSDRFSMALQHTGYRVLTSIGLLVLFLTILFAGYLTFTGEVESGEPIPIAVVDFINQTGESELDGLSGMLITALEQSRRLSVLTRSRMFDILKQMGRENVERIDETLGREICKKANLDALVIASIMKFGNIYSIDLKVLDPNRDEYLFTAKEEGSGKESIPSMVDRLSEKTRIGLKEKSEEIRLFSQEVAEVTTPNLEAYQHYFEGEELLNKLHFDEARKEFLKAISLDSTFALAYYRLAYTSWWTQESERVQKEQLQKAVDLIDRIPEKERYLVRADMVRVEEGYEVGIEALKVMEKIYPNDKELLYNIGDWSFHIGRNQTAMEYLEKVLVMDPYHERTLQHLTWTYAYQGFLDKMYEVVQRLISVDEIEGTIMLGQYYSTIGDHRKAEESYKNVLAMASEHPYALSKLASLYGDIGDYDQFLEYARRYSAVSHSWTENAMLGAAYMATGNLKKSMKKFQKAREIAPVTYEIIEGIAGLYLIQGQPELAREEFETLMRQDPSHISKLVGLGGLRRIATYLGQYREAIRLSDQLIELHREVNDTTRLAQEYLTRGALLMRGWDDREVLRDAIEQTIPLQDHVTGFSYWGGLIFNHVLIGDYKTAERIASERMKAILWYDPLLRLAIHSEKGELDQAEPLADSLLTACVASIRIIVLYTMAEEYFEAGRPDETIASLLKLQSVIGGGLNWSVFYPKSLHLIGMAYEQKGELELARESYGKLLEIWEDADDDLPALIDTEERLANLKGLALK